MSLSALFFIVIFIPAIILVPAGYKAILGLLISALLVIVSSATAISVFYYGSIHYTLTQLPFLGNLELSADKPSGFFILMVNTGAILTALYLRTYILKYKEALVLNICIISFNFLHIILLLTVIISN